MRVRRELEAISWRNATEQEYRTHFDEQKKNPLQGLFMSRYGHPQGKGNGFDSIAEYCCFPFHGAERRACRSTEG